MGAGGGGDATNNNNNNNGGGDNNNGKQQHHHQRGLLYVAEREGGVGGKAVHKMDHLVCFLPGVLAGSTCPFTSAPLVCIIKPPQLKRLSRICCFFCFFF